MRILLAGAAAIALSGCSFLGLGGNHDYNNYGYNANTGNYGYQAQKPAPKACTSGQCLSRWNLEAAIGPHLLLAVTLLRVMIQMLAAEQISTRSALMKVSIEAGVVN